MLTHSPKSSNYNRDSRSSALFLSPDCGRSSAILFLLPVHLLYSHTSILFWVMCYQWHSVEQLLSKLWTKRDYSLSTDEVVRLTGSHNCVYNYKHLESLPDTSSQIFDWKQFARHSSLSLGK